MNIRAKTLLIISTTLLGLLIVIYWASAAILTANLKVLEKQATMENVDRVRDAFTQRIERIDTTTSSWAQWDDTCRFLKDGNRAYIEANLTPASITTAKSNVFVLMRTDGLMVFGRNHDLKSIKNLPLDPQLKSVIKPGSLLLRHSSNRDRHIGILQTKPLPLLVVTRPVVNNSGGGPVRGTLLTGVYLSASEVQEISKITHLNVESRRLNASPLLADFQLARVQLPTSKAIWVNPLDADTIAGYSLIDDIFGQPALLLRVTARRDIFRQGQLGIRNVLVALLISGIIFGIVTLMLLERLVLSRVSRLSREVQSISEQRDFSKTVGVEGRDELSNLSTNLNSMIRTLHAALLQKESDRNAIEASLREKDTLLKEVYHRVKNNLQIVSSLLSMQSDGIEEVETRLLFEDSRNRVRSMALVHEKLYQSTDLGRINFGEYLDNLSHTLLRSYSNRGGQIALQLETETVQLDLDLAVPCGLIVNELITNSLKYAFPKSRSGIITVGLKKCADGQLCLSVSDDGVGIPANFEVDEAQSIGMQLVTGLTQQLEGRYELKRGNGTRWDIYFRSGKM